MNETRVRIVIPEMMVLDFQRSMRDLAASAPSMTKAESLQTSFRSAFQAEGNLGAETLVFRRGKIGGGDERTALNMIQRRKGIVLRIEDHTTDVPGDIRSMTRDENIALVARWMHLWGLGMEALKTRSVLNDRPVGENEPDKPVHDAIRRHVAALAQSEGLCGDVFYDTNLPIPGAPSSVVITDKMRTLRVTGAYEAYARSLGVDVAAQIDIYDDASLSDTLRIRHRRMPKEKTAPAGTVEAIRTLADPCAAGIDVREEGDHG